MIHGRTKLGQSGQSLIELIVVLPVFLLFLTIVYPLLSSGIVTPWLDEKLWLRQFLQEGKFLQSELEDIHEKNMIPLYFVQSDLEETTHQEKLGFSFPLLTKSFPGLITNQKVLAKHPEVHGIILGEANRSCEKISRSLAILTSPIIAESDIPFRIRKLSVLGVFPRKIVALRNLNLEFFHLNLDALPEADQ